MKRLVIGLVAVAALFAFSGGAYAGSTSMNMQVSANVLAWCAMGVDPVNFGDYSGNQISVPLNVLVLCSNTAPYAVTMDAGMHYSGGWRHVSDGTNGIIYELFDPSSSFEWSDVGYAGTYPFGGPVTGTGTGGTETLSGTAILFGGYATTPGTYTDTVLVSVNY
jgi:spore coat protein U domain-containing protein, fimbrial subunit CupE1/2/3/6